MKQKFELGQIVKLTSEKWFYFSEKIFRIVGTKEKPFTRQSPFNDNEVKIENGKDYIILMTYFEGANNSDVCRKPIHVCEDEIELLTE